MIQKITLGNFKSFKQATLKLDRLTLMVGANASGKSNALEAIRFLSWLAQGRKLQELQYQVNQSDQVVRGETRDMFYRDSDVFSIGVTKAERSEIKNGLENLGPGLRLDFSFDLRKEEDLRIKSEACFFSGDASGSDFLYRSVRRYAGMTADYLKVEYNNFNKGTKNPIIDCIDQQAVFTQLTTPARFGKNDKKAQTAIPIASAVLSKELAGIAFLDPQPHSMRQSANKQEKRLQENGSNLSAVLYNLWQQGKESQEAVLSFVQSLPEQDIVRLAFLEGFKNDVLLQLVESFGGAERPIDTFLLSDGTLRVLAIAAALLSGPQGSMVIIEEIDNGVHPNRTQALLQNIFTMAERRDLTVLISSHNPALMDALPIKAVPSTVFCYRDPEDGSSKLVQLSELARYPELIAQGSLGHLVTEGILDRFVKQPKSEEARQAEAMQWLDSIK